MDLDFGGNENVPPNFTGNDPSLKHEARALIEGTRSIETNDLMGYQAGQTDRCWWSSLDFQQPSHDTQITLPRASNSIAVNRGLRHNDPMPAILSDDVSASPSSDELRSAIDPPSGFNLASKLNTPRRNMTGDHPRYPARTHGPEGTRKSEMSALLMPSPLKNLQQQIRARIQAPSPPDPRFAPPQRFELSSRNCLSPKSRKSVTVKPPALPVYHPNYENSYTDYRSLQEGQSKDDRKSKKNPMWCCLGLDWR